MSNKPKKNNVRRLPEILAELLRDFVKLSVAILFTLALLCLLELFIAMFLGTPVLSHQPEVRPVLNSVFSVSLIFIKCIAAAAIITFFMKALRDTHKAPEEDQTAVPPEDLLITTPEDPLDRKEKS